MKRFICLFTAVLIAATAFVAVPAGAVETHTVTRVMYAEAKLPYPKNVNKSSTSTSITLSWDKVDGASAYKVFILDDVLGEYTVYKTVKKTTITIKGS